MIIIYGGKTKQKNYISIMDVFSIFFFIWNKVLCQKIE